MGVASKRRRKIKVEGRRYLWYVRDDPDSEAWVLHVLSEDKAFIVKYHLGQPAEGRYLIVLGPDFAGLPDAGGQWIRVLCPAWEKGGTVGPGDVRLVADDARVRLLASDATSSAAGVAVDLEGRPGDLVSLFPVGADVEGVSTDGLRYPLVAATLLVGRTRGLSNVRTATVARVAMRQGRLLIVEAPATL